ncbi:MAG: metal ABC transporter permease [Candidatus Muiribacteriota bacterium]|jgi:zinc transport system permease protein
MEIFELLQYEFIRNAFLAGLLISIPCGIIGTIIIVNRMVFASDGIAHASFGGIGLAVFLGLSPYTGAAVFSLAAAMVTAMLTYGKKFRSDGVIGVIMAVSMAFGVFMINITPGYVTEPVNYLFGNILLVTFTDIINIFIFVFLLLIVIFLFYRKILAVCYDSYFAEVRDINVKFYHFLIYMLVAGGVVFIVKISGIILFIALLTIPPMIVEKYSKNLISMFFYSSILTLILILTGLFLSIKYNISSGSSIILLSGSIFIILNLFDFLKKTKNTHFNKKRVDKV